MPAFLTHWRILIATAQMSQDAGSDLGSLIVNADTLRRRNHGWSTPPQTTPTGAVWDTGPYPDIDIHFPGSDISAMAFLGALAPDITTYRRRSGREAAQTQTTLASLTARNPLPWSDLFHHHSSGTILIAFLEQVALVPSPALRSQALAFALGYISHIATDIALNPWIDDLATRLPKRGHQQAHTAIELRLDEYLAETYFKHPRYNILHQPWGEYIEPVASSLLQTGSLERQILQLLALASEVYQLEDEQSATLPTEFLAGLQKARLYLAGRGRARWQALRASRQKAQPDLLSKVLANPANATEIIALDNILHYTEHLSELLCKQAINYYTALRNPNAEASERSSRRAALLNNLRNWDLTTGYETAESQAESAKLHNWTHFAHLWEKTGEQEVPLPRLSMPRI